MIILIFHLHLLQSIFLTTGHQNQKIAIIDIAAGPELASVNCCQHIFQELIPAGIMAIQRAQKSNMLKVIN
jgi:hypothetical protein